MSLDVEKDMEGRALMLKMTKPRKPRKSEREAWAAHCEEHDLGEKPHPVVWHETEESIFRNHEYCERDVETEEAFSEACPDLSARELALWQLDQEINWHGVKTDLTLARCALMRAGEAKKLLAAELSEITNCDLKPSQRAKVKEWLEATGFEIEDTKSSTVDWYLGNYDFKDDRHKRVLQIVKAYNRTSVRKFQAIIDKTDPEDGRARDILMYHGASTGRWSGRGIQVQNFPRGNAPDNDGYWNKKKARWETYFSIDKAVEEVKDLSVDTPTLAMLYDDVMELLSSCLRGAIMPSHPDNDMIVADYSAIEARCVLWEAGAEKALEVFRTGGDIYCDMAEGIYGYPVNKKDNPQERQFGKQCLAGDTLILTSNGIKKIVDVMAWDMLWDGQHWVDHEGLICQGRKQTITVNGVRMTPDHKVMNQTGQMVEASQVLDGSSNFLKLGTPSANSLSLKLPSGRGEALSQYIVNVSAAIGQRPIRLTWFRGKREPATTVQKSKRPASVGIDIETPCRTMHTGNGFLTVCRQRFLGAITQKIKPLSTMGFATYRSVKAGVKTVPPSSAMCKPSLIGMRSNLKWTGSTATGVTNRETYDSQAGQKTFETEGGLKTSNGKFDNLEPVYDIANAGPNHRFTIVDPEGNYRVVSNCILGLGYGMGYITFLLTCRAYNITFEIDQVKKIVGELYDKYEAWVQRNLMAPVRRDDEDVKDFQARVRASVKKRNMLRDARVDPEKSIHELVLMKYTVEVYRKRYPEVPALWRAQEAAAIKAIEAAEDAVLEEADRLGISVADEEWVEFSENFKGPEIEAGCCTWFMEQGFLCCRLPSDRLLRYRGAFVQSTKTEWGEKKPAIRYMTIVLGTKWARTATYGGKIVENITQAVARDIMADAMLAMLGTHYRLLMTVHDELVAEAARDLIDKDEFEALMCQVGPWADGCPVSAEADVMPRYRK